MLIIGIINFANICVISKNVRVPSQNMILAFEEKLSFCQKLYEGIVSSCKCPIRVYTYTVQIMHI